jgi:hypothetical protein
MKQPQNTYIGGWCDSFNCCSMQFTTTLFIMAKITYKYKKKIKYGVSGIWLLNNPHNEICDLLIHKIINDETRLAIGTKVGKSKVIELINAGNEFVTVEWNYETAIWQRGALIHVVENKYLRTNHDPYTEDNLKNIINMTIIPIQTLGL